LSVSDIYFLIIDLVYDRDNCKYYKIIMETSINRPLLMEM
jgi:hypothetical protein